MRNEPLTHLKGTYRYASRGDLDRALAQALDHMHDDDHEAGLPHDMFRTRGTTLRVDLALPAAACRFVAATVMEILAGRAIEGVVEACGDDGRCFDYFPAQA